MATPIKLQCNLCPYHMIVSESLEPWASQVMEKHGAHLHPEALEAIPPNEAQDAKAA